MQLLDRLWDTVQTERLVWATFRAQGAEIDEPPGYDEAIAGLDETLAAPFVWTDDDPNAELREVLGLARR